MRTLSGLRKGVVQCSISVQLDSQIGANKKQRSCSHWRAHSYVISHLACKQPICKGRQTHSETVLKLREQSEDLKRFSKETSIRSPQTYWLNCPLEKEQLLLLKVLVMCTFFSDEWVKQDTTQNLGNHLLFWRHKPSDIAMHRSRSTPLTAGLYIDMFMLWGYSNWGGGGEGQWCFTPASN